jgi:hypothetical protein
VQVGPEGKPPEDEASGVAGRWATWSAAASGARTFSSAGKAGCTGRPGFRARHVLRSARDHPRIDARGGRNLRKVEMKQAFKVEGRDVLARSGREPIVYPPFAFVAWK